MEVPLPLATALGGVLSVTVFAAVFRLWSHHAAFLSVFSGLRRMVGGPAEPAGADRELSDEGEPNGDAEAEAGEQPQPSSWFGLRRIFQAFGLLSNHSEEEEDNETDNNRPARVTTAPVQGAPDEHDAETGEQPQPWNFFGLRPIFQAFGLLSTEDKHDDNRPTRVKGAPKEDADTDEPSSWFGLRPIFQAFGLLSTEETKSKRAASSEELDEPVADEQPSWLSVKGALQRLGLTWKDAESGASSHQIYDVIPNHKHKFMRVHELGHYVQEPQRSESTRVTAGTAQVQPDAKIRRPRISLPIKTHLPVSLRPYGLRALQTTGSVK